eukprot:587882-Amphidinium_carterae.1
MPSNQLTVPLLENSCWAACSWLLPLCVCSALHVEVRVCVPFQSVMLLVPAFLYSAQLSRTAILLFATSTLYLLDISTNACQSSQGQADCCSKEGQECKDQQTD